MAECEKGTRLGGEEDEEGDTVSPGASIAGKVFDSWRSREEGRRKTNADDDKI